MHQIKWCDRSFLWHKFQTIENVDIFNHRYHSRCVQIYLLHHKMQQQHKKGLPFVSDGVCVPYLISYRIVYYIDMKMLHVGNILITVGTRMLCTIARLSCSLLYANVNAVFLMLRLHHILSRLECECAFFVVVRKMMMMMMVQMRKELMFDDDDDHQVKPPHNIAWTDSKIIYQLGQTQNYASAMASFYGRFNLDRQRRICECESVFMRFWNRFQNPHTFNLLYSSNASQNACRWQIIPAHHHKRHSRFCSIKRYALPRPQYANPVAPIFAIKYSILAGTCCIRSIFVTANCMCVYISFGSLPFTYGGDYCSEIAHNTPKQRLWYGYCTMQRALNRQAIRAWETHVTCLSLGSRRGMGPVNVSVIIALSTCARWDSFASTGRCTFAHRHVCCVCVRM